MQFEDSVEKGLSRCLVAAGALPDPAHNDLDGVSLLLALSGGVDSTALLVALRAISLKKVGTGAALGLDLAACHVNHNLRGADSAADEQFCRDFCEELEVPLTVVEINTEGDSEAELREARYAKLIKVAKQSGAPYIVTAHHLDDQIETLFFRLLRGSSVRGLVGMDAARPMDISMWPILLRPMLDISRDQIEAYLAESGVSGRLDKTNSDVRYSRNFLRSQIIAPLKQKFPVMAANIEHFRQTLQNENDYMAEQAAELFERARRRHNELSLEVLAAAHPALAARAITAFIEEAGIVPSFYRVQRIMQLIDQVSGHGAAQACREKERVIVAGGSLGQNLELLVSKDSILLKPLYELSTSEEEIEARLEAMPPVSIKMPRPGRSSAITMVPWLDFAVSVAELSEPAGQGGEGGEVDRAQSPEGAPASGGAEAGEGAGGRHFDRRALSVPVHLKELAGRLCLRPRRSGDYLQPAGMVEQVRLKQYLHANKNLFAGARKLVPAFNDMLALRLFPVLALEESQEVLWVPGFGLSEKIKCGGKASHLISLIPIADEAEARAGIDAGTC